MFLRTISVMNVPRGVEFFACEFWARQECDPSNPVERCRVDWVAVLLQKALSVSLDHAWRSVTIKSMSARLIVILPPLWVVLGWSLSAFNVRLLLIRIVLASVSMSAQRRRFARPHTGFKLHADERNQSELF